MTVNPFKSFKTLYNGKTQCISSYVNADFPIVQKPLDDFNILKMNKIIALRARILRTRQDEE